MIRPVPISIGIIALALVFAFYDFLRALIRSICTYALAWIAVRTGLYGAWLNHRSDFASVNLMEETMGKVEALKEEVKKVRRRKYADKYYERREQGWHGV